MCGIMGSIGKNSINNVINGLKVLEYRGYDSAGIAFEHNNSIEIIKEVGKVKNLENKLPSLDSNLAIGHTRWATHGEPTQLNAHPHYADKVTLVHNGIIENYLELKNILIENNYSFYSDTDTEVACKYIDYLYNLNNGDVLKTLQEAMKTFIGSYAMCIIFKDKLDTIYTIKYNAPLIIGKGKENNLISSDILGVLEITNEYYLLPDKFIGTVEANDINFFDEELKQIELKVEISNKVIDDCHKGEFEHFMQKEIYQEPEVIINTIDNYKDKVILNLNNYKEVNFVACGSAMYVSEIASSLFKNLKMKSHVYCASEFRYSHNLIENDKETLFIFVSQSGETADTLKSLELVNSYNIDTVAIVNVSESSIDRTAKTSLLTYAGSEISVATTKAFISQLTLLSLIYIQNELMISEISKDTKEKIYNETLNILSNLKTDIVDIINNPMLLEIANRIKDEEHIYFLGRGIDKAIADEGSLKLKEISYIHSEAYPAGELKHGSIALINNNTYVIGILTDEKLKEKTISNLKEVHSRGAKIILITNKEFNVEENLFEYIIPVENYNLIATIILTIVNLQILAYNTAKLLDREIDQPKNLAKSVTVE